MRMGFLLIAIMLATALSLQAVPNLSLPKAHKKRVLHAQVNFNIKKEPKKELAPNLSFKPGEISDLLQSVEEIYQATAEMEAKLEALEKSLAYSGEKLNLVIADIDNGIDYKAVDLEKYATGKIDISEKYIYAGITYDKDIYDHAHELATRQKLNDLKSRIYDI